MTLIHEFIPMTPIRDNLIFPELSYKITGILFKTHNALGRYCKEKQYQDALAEMFEKEGFIFECEKKLPISEKVGGNQVDFLVDNKILIECKAKPIITKEDYYQVLRYLKASGKHLCLLVNFRNQYLRPKRIVN